MYYFNSNNFFSNSNYCVVFFCGVFFCGVFFWASRLPDSDLSVRFFKISAHENLTTRTVIVYYFVVFFFVSLTSKYAVSFVRG